MFHGVGPASVEKVLRFAGRGLVETWGRHAGLAEKLIVESRARPSAPEAPTVPIASGAVSRRRRPLHHIVGDGEGAAHPGFPQPAFRAFFTSGLSVSSA